jgi:molecular chaperone DnaJ
MTCAGVGAIRRTMKENCVIPKGVYDGVTLRMAGKGNSSMLGGQPGDLLIKVQIRPHPYF